MGSLGLHFRGHPDHGDVGYWIGEPFWNRGFATEAVGLATHLAFEHLEAGARSAWVFEGNEPSRRVLEKVGFRYVRTSDRELAGGRTQREWSLALLREEWERMEDRLRPVAETIELVD